MDHFMVTPQVIKASFAKHGLSIRDWAQKHGFNEDLVYAVLNGRNQASRGESFQIAVALGLKEKPDLADAPACLQNFISEAQAQRSTQ
jgi:gp16 family phage-associated protein